MARLGQPLTVAAFVLCVLFCGFAAAVTAGGENWGARAAELDEYAITTVGGGDQPVRYQVTDRVSTETVTTANSLPAAVVAAYKQRANVLQAERTAIQERVDRLKREAPLRKELNAADRAAMDVRLEGQQAEYERISDELVAVTDAGKEFSSQAERIRVEAGVRADDAARLAAELDALRADAVRIESQIAALEDRRVRLEGALARAERRREQLASRLE